MKRRLYEVASIVFLVAALFDAGFAVVRGLPAAWPLFIAPCVVFGVITSSQRMPVASLNLTVKVTAENARQIDPVTAEFLASVKAWAMALIAWLNHFAVFRVSTALILFRRRRDLADDLVIGHSISRKDS